MDERERDFIAYIYLCGDVYYGRMQETLWVRKSLCNETYFYVTTCIFLFIMYI